MLETCFSFVKASHCLEHVTLICPIVLFLTVVGGKVDLTMRLTVVTVLVEPVLTDKLLSTDIAKLHAYNSNTAVIQTLT